MRGKVVYFLVISLSILGCNQPQIEDKFTTIEGKITYDRVYSKILDDGIVKLDYNNIKRLPSRHVLVKAIDINGKTITATSTDDKGKYILKVPKNINIKIRAYAKMFKDGYWDVKVVDNTNNSAMYVIDGNYHNSGDKKSIRNLHAISGWNRNGSYTNPRIAAPFAILDSIYQAMKRVIEVDADVIFPELTVNWSTRNVASPGDESNGQIITSNYDGEQNLWILGDENGDTDEYDDHIIIHEWAHYFEDQFSRADNIGGSHSLGEALDIRVAFGEGWGNAFSAIATDNPIYFDTYGYKQSTGWYMDIEKGKQEIKGWYSEGSIQRILYDLYDNSNEVFDKTSLGFFPIYKVLVGRERTTPAFTSIFTFINALKIENPEYSIQIDETLEHEDINMIVDDYGSNRVNRADITLYKNLDENSSINTCTINNFGVYNKLGNRVYIRTHIKDSGIYKFEAVSDLDEADPDFILYNTSYPHNQIAISQLEGASEDSLTISLSKGEYLIDIYDASFHNSCLNLSLNKEKIKYNQKDITKLISKLKHKRRLPKRQYY